MSARHRRSGTSLRSRLFARPRAPIVVIKTVPILPAADERATAIAHFPQPASGGAAAHSRSIYPSTIAGPGAEAVPLSAASAPSPRPARAHVNVARVEV